MMTSEIILNEGDNFDENQKFLQALKMQILAL